jgi:exonuclease SbcC
VNPLRLWARGYRTFDELELDIPSGCTAVVGANGAGKSSTVNVIDLALFAEAGELNDELSTDHDALEVGLEFEQAGERYRVRRQLRRGKSATLDFERRTSGDTPDVLTFDSDWEPLTREKTAETARLISDTIGLTRASFRASAFMRQKDAGAFAEAQPSKRKERLAEILQLERWEQRREHAATAARARDTELTRLAGRAELAELTAKLRPEVERALENLRLREQEGVALVESIEQAAEQLQVEISVTAAAKERVRTCEAEVQAAKADEHRARDLLLEAQQAKARADAKQAELEQLTELASHGHHLEADLATARDLREQATAAVRARDDLLAASANHRDTATRIRNEGDRLAAHHTLLASRLVELQHAEDGTERCDRCEQLLGAEAKATAVKSLQRELDELETRISEQANDAIGEERLARETAAEAAKADIPAVPDIARLEADLARARDAHSRQDALEHLLAGYREKTVKLPLLETELMQLTAVTAAKQTTLEQATAAAGDTAALEQQLAAMRSDLTRARVALEEMRRTVAQQEGQLQRVEEADAELAEILLKRKEIQADLDQLKLGEKAFGRDGVPAILVEAVAVPQIERRRTVCWSSCRWPTAASSASSSRRRPRTNRTTTSVRRSTSWSATVTRAAGMRASAAASRCGSTSPSAARSPSSSRTAAAPRHGCSSSTSPTGSTRPRCKPCRRSSSSSSPPASSTGS